jgi:hypothetical protein
MDGILREKLPELIAKLGRQSFVVRDHQSWQVYLLDHIGDGEGLTRTGYAEKRLIFFAGFQTGHQFLYGLRLIASRFIV